MKSLLMFAAVCIVTLAAHGQDDKSKRPSPPATATGSTASGTTIPKVERAVGVSGTKKNLSADYTYYADS